jgi:hypothetical protein
LELTVSTLQISALSSRANKQKTFNSNQKKAHLNQKNCKTATPVTHATSEKLHTVIVEESDIHIHAHEAIENHLTMINATMLVQLLLVFENKGTHITRL